jgi:hypothetical protein
VRGAWLLVAALVATSCSGGSSGANPTNALPSTTPRPDMTVFAPGSPVVPTARPRGPEPEATSSTRPTLTGAANRDGVSLRFVMQPAVVDPTRPLEVRVEVVNDTEERVLLDATCGLIVGVGMATSTTPGAPSTRGGRLGAFRRLALEQTPLGVVAHHGPESGDCTGAGGAIRLPPGTVHDETIVLEPRHARRVPVGPDGTLTVLVAVRLVDRQMVDDRRSDVLLRAEARTVPTDGLPLSGGLSPVFAVDALLADHDVASIIERSDRATWELDMRVFVPEGMDSTVRYVFTFFTGGTLAFRRLVYGRTGRVVDPGALVTNDQH